MLAMEVNDDAGSLAPPRCPEVFREHARSYRDRGLTLFQNSKQCTATPGCTVDER
jgi:hypothetical protein